MFYIWRFNLSESWYTEEDRAERLEDIIEEDEE